MLKFCMLYKTYKFLFLVRRKVFIIRPLNLIYGGLVSIQKESDSQPFTRNYKTVGFSDYIKLNLTF